MPDFEKALPQFTMVMRDFRRLPQDLGITVMGDCGIRIMLNTIQAIRLFRAWPWTSQQEFSGRTAFCSLVNMCGCSPADLERLGGSRVMARSNLNFRIHFFSFSIEQNMGLEGESAALIRRRQRLNCREEKATHTHATS